MSEALGIKERTELWGVAPVDWNGDGCDDLYVGRHARQIPHLYRNPCPGVFVNEVWRLGIPDPPEQHSKDRHTPLLGDYDGDGRVDLYIPTGANRGKGYQYDQLYRQNPDGTFTDVAPALGLTDPYGSGRAGVWLDYDNDGDLDLFMVHWYRAVRPEENKHKLWAQEGGTFRDVSAAAGVAVGESGGMVVASDIDLDGDLDLLVVPGTGASLYRNRGDGTFSRERFNLPAMTNVAVGDYDNDGDLDLHLTSRVRLSELLRNDGGVWTPVGAAAGVVDSLTTSSAWVDVDNDGDLDLFVVRVRDPREEQNLPDRLYQNNGDGTFTDVAAAAGVTGPSSGTGQSVAWGDVDRDGFQDLFVANSRAAISVAVYRNNRTPYHWVTFHLSDPASLNRQGIGARIEVMADGRFQLREHVIMSSYNAQSAQYVPIGLGTATEIALLTIRWPDGVVERYRHVPADRHYTVVKGTGLRNRRVSN